MVGTFICFFIPLLLLAFSHISSRTKKPSKIIYICVCTYILVFSWSLIKRSGDYVHYQVSFDNINSWQDYLLGTALKGYEFEPGYVLLNLFLKNFITIDPYYAIGIITSITGIGYLYYFRKYSNYVYLAIVVYIAHFYWWSGIVLLRQMCATLILFPLLDLMIRHKYFKSVCLIIIASCFHSSSVIFLPFLFLYKKNFFKIKYVVSYIVISFICGFLDILKIFFSICASIIPRGDVFFARYLENEGKSLNVLSLVEMLFILYISIKYRNKLIRSNQYFKIAIDLLVFSTILSLCLMKYEIGMRLTLFFNLYSYIILLPTLIAIFKPNAENRIGYILILGSYMSLFLIRFVYITI